MLPATDELCVKVALALPMLALTWTGPAHPPPPTQAPFRIPTSIAKL